MFCHPLGEVTKRRYFDATKLTRYGQQSAWFATKFLEKKKSKYPKTKKAIFERTIIYDWRVGAPSKWALTHASRY
jgi:hypothetical protein